MFRYDALPIRFDLSDRKTEIEQLRNVMSEEAGEVGARGVCGAFQVLACHLQVSQDSVNRESSV